LRENLLAVHLQDAGTVLAYPAVIKADIMLTPSIGLCLMPDASRIVGTMRGDPWGFGSGVVRSILPPNFCGGAGSYPPLMVIVARGAPGRPVICRAKAPSISSLTF